MIRRKIKGKPLEPIYQRREIIEYEGKKYYKLKRDEKIEKGALHQHYYGKRCNLIKHEKTIGKKPSDFMQRRFYNPLPQIYIKKEKFKIEMLYDVE